MGRFQLNFVERRAKKLKSEKGARIKASLHSRPLLTPIPDPPTKKHPIEDGILLFGKHTGEKVLSLLRSYENSAYVLEYLSKSHDLPKSFRKQIDAILENSDPWGDSVPKEIPSGLAIREIFEDEEEEDLPW